MTIKNNIMIIGGAGFIGRNLVNALNKSKYDLVCLDNHSNSDVFPPLVNCPMIYCNTYNEKNLRKQFKIWKPSIVFHLGEYARVVPSFIDKKYVFKSNLLGTSNVINLCAEYGSKLIYSASSSKFGGNENLSPYSWTKAKMVELIKNFKNWYNLNYQICYFYNVYGQGETEIGDYATVIGRFKNQYKNGLPITVIGDGKQTRQFTHVDDITDALLKIMDYKENKEWYLTSGKTYSILEVARMFSDNIEFVPTIKGERKNAINIKNDTRKLLDWKPKRNLIDYILSTKST